MRDSDRLQSQETLPRGGQGEAVQISSKPHPYHPTYRPLVVYERIRDACCSDWVHAQPHAGKEERGSVLVQTLCPSLAGIRVRRGFSTYNFFLSPA